MAKRWLISLTLISASCAMVQATSHPCTLIAKPQILSGRFTQTTINPYIQSSIQHLNLKLFIGEQDTGIHKTLLNAQLGNPVVFNNLKDHTTYRIKAYAYSSTDDSALISVDDTNSWTDITLTDDDRPTVATLKVKLIDIPFNAQGTGSLQINPGGYSPVAPENMEPIRIMGTFAGNGTASFTGDGGLATVAGLNRPSCMTFDSLGNLYFGDYSNCRIRKITPLGAISTYAGGGTSGYGGPATAAPLSTPIGCTIGPSGDLYISDFGLHRVFKVDKTTGVITTVVGNGTAAFAGDGGPATAANLDHPHVVAFDSSGNLYVVDRGNNRIRKVDKTTGTISTYAGNGTSAYSGDGGAASAASLSSPNMLAFDTSDNLYVSDRNNHRIRKITPAGIISTFAGGGTGIAGVAATAAYLPDPIGLVFDTVGNLYVADVLTYSVRKIDKTTGIISTFAGNGGTSNLVDSGVATSVSLKNPTNVVFDAYGNLYVADETAHRIRVIR